MIKAMVPQYGGDGKPGMRDGMVESVMCGWVYRSSSLLQQSIIHLV
jgi:hypothetical protein